MDLLFDIAVEFLFTLVEKGIKGIKNEKLQVFAAATFAFVAFASLVGFATWMGVSFYREGTMVATIFCGAIVALAILLIGFIILRRIIRKRKIEP